MPLAMWSGKIAASAAKDECEERPVFTPCCLALGKKRDRLAAGPTPDPGATSDSSAASGIAPLETAVQKCGS